MRDRSDARYPRGSRRPRLRLSEEEFESVVTEALDGLPDEFAELLENVAVVVEEEPSEEVISSFEDDDPDDPHRGEIFGLYQGIPLTERDSFYGAVLPDRISLYRGPLLRHCRSRREAIDEITKTVLHELGHYFGMEEEDMPY